MNSRLSASFQEILFVRSILSRISGLRRFVCGELQEYTDMLSDARRESLNRMMHEAKRMEADAVVNVRFVTSQTTAGDAKLLAYGAAVKLVR